MEAVKQLSRQKKAYTVSPARINITDLRLRTLIGFNPEEMVKPQDVIINATLFYKADEARLTDDEQDVLDYKVITKRIIAHVEGHAFKLLEKLTGDVLDIIMDNPQVTSASVTIDKPHALRFADSVSITLEATR